MVKICIQNEIRMAEMCESSRYGAFVAKVLSDRTCVGLLMSPIACDGKPFKALNTTPTVFGSDRVGRQQVIGNSGTCFRPAMASVGRSGGAQAKRDLDLKK